MQKICCINCLENNTGITLSLTTQTTYILLISTDSSNFGMSTDL